MKRSLFLSTYLASGIAFAKADAAGSPAVPPAVGTTETPAGVQIFGARTDIKVPEKARRGRGGGKSPYNFDSLEVGASIGIAGKAKKNFSSILYTLNGKYAEPVRDEAGNQKTEMKVVKKKDGTTENKIVNLTKPTRTYEAFDVDPATDPDKATVRIFRTL